MRTVIILLLIAHSFNTKGQIKILAPLLHESNITRVLDLSSLESDPIINPDDFNGMMNEGLNKLEVHEYLAAIHYFKKAQGVLDSYSSPNQFLNEFNYENPYPTYYLGVSFARWGILDSALHYYRKSTNMLHQQVPACIDMAVIFLHAEETDSAKKYLDIGQQVDRNNRELELLKSQWYRQTNEFRTALRQSKKVILKYPDFLNAYVFLADLYAGLFKFSDQKKTFNLMVKNNPGSSEAYSLRASFFFGEDEVELALRDVQKSLLIDSGNYQARLTLGLWELKFENYAEAGNQISRAIYDSQAYQYSSKQTSLFYPDAEFGYFINYLTGTPRSSEEYAIFGLIVQALINASEKSTENALTKLKERALSQVQQNQDSEFAMRVLAYINLLFSHDHSTEVLVNDILKKFDAWNLRVLRINFYLRLKQWTRSIEECQNLLLNRPNDVLLNYYLGLSYKGTDELTKAIDSFGKAIKYDPFFVEAIYEKAMALEKKENYLQAIEFFEDYQAKFLKTDSIHYRLGQLYCKAKYWTKAKSLAEDGSVLWPEHGGFYALKANIFYHENEYDSAIQNYEYALVRSFADDHARENLGAIFRELEEKEKAIRFLSNCIYHNPNSTKCYKYRGELFYQAKMYQPAYDDFKKALQNGLKDHSLDEMILELKNYLQED